MRRHPTQFPIRLALVLALILLAGAGATPASAGEYPVYACEPSQGDVNNSWQAYSNRRGILVYVACRGRPGALGPWDQGLVTRAMINRRNKGATIRKGASARLAFTAPPGATLSRISYVGSLCGTAGHIALLQADVIPVTFGFSQPPADCPSKAPTGSTVPLFGKTTVSLRTACALKRCSVGGGRPRAWAALRSATVYVSDNTPPSVSVTGGAGLAPGWKRGAVDVRFGAGDNVGIRYAKLDAAGATSNETRPSCDYTRPAPCTNLNSAFTVNTRAIPDGDQAFVLSAEDAAGNWASQPFTLRVDNTAPGPPLGLAVVGGAQWRARNAFSIEWRNPSQAGTAPIAGVWTAVCPAVSDVEDWSACVVGPQRTPDEVASGIEVPRSGMWVARVWLQDAAGNEDRQTAQAVPLNFDDTPPTVDIAPMDIADPTRIDVHASDVISPLARIEIEVRRRGKRAWIGLPATVTATHASMMRRCPTVRMSSGRERQTAPGTNALHTASPLATSQCAGSPHGSTRALSPDRSRSSRLDVRAVVAVVHDAWSSFVPKSSTGAQSRSEVGSPWPAGTLWPTRRSRCGNSPGFAARSPSESP
jgi:hypothetical protein